MNKPKKANLEVEEEGLAMTDRQEQSRTTCRNMLWVEQTPQSFKATFKEEEEGETD